LDEPTTGLSAADALQVVNVLRFMANRGHSIACTIHQPRQEIFNLFDAILILAKGRLVFNGPHQQLRAYFRSMGHAIPRGYSVSDFVIDVVSDVHVQEGGGDDSGSDGMDKCAGVANMADRYMHSGVFQEVMQKIQHATSLSVRDIDSVIDSDPEAFGDLRFPLANGFYKEFPVVLARAARHRLREKSLFQAILIQAVFVALIIGGALSTSSETDGIQVTYCAIAVGTIVGSGLMVLIVSQIHEHDLMRQERAAGMYRTFSSFLAGVVVETPLFFVAGLVFTLIGYFMMPLKHSWDKIGYFVLLLGCFMNASASMVGLLSSFTSDFNAAVDYALTVLRVYQITSGFFVNYDDMGWTKYFSWVSIFRYAVFGIMLNEFDECENGNVQAGRCEALEIYALPIYEGETKWTDLGLMCCMWAVFRMVMYLSLKYFRRH
jgi:ABC-type multidrug transport system fused ATPase/permease subunit